MEITTIKIQYVCVVKVHSRNGSIISVEQTKKLLNNPKLSDEQAEEIRDGFRMLGEVIFDKWYDERKKTKQQQGEKAIIN